MSPIAKILLSSILFALTSPAPTQAEPAEAVFMDLNHCKPVKSDSTAEPSRSLCGAIGEYTLYVDKEDDRATLTMKTGKKFVPLDFQTKVTHSFSELAPQVEWRVRRGVQSRTPFAIIADLRWNQDDPAARGEYFIVSRLLEMKSCVVAKIAVKGSREEAKNQARKLADAVSEKTSCINKAD